MWYKNYGSRIIQSTTTSRFDVYYHGTSNCVFFIFFIFWIEMGCLICLI